MVSVRVAQILKSHEHRRCVTSNLKNIIACVTQIIKTSSSVRALKLFGFDFVQFFWKKCQKIEFWRARGECPKSQKKWSKTHFFPSVQKKNRTKSGQNLVWEQGDFDFPGDPRGAAFVWFFAQKSQGIDFYNHWCSRVHTLRKQQRAAKSFLWCVWTWVSWF